MVCEDGHKVKSNFERNVCNWLHKNNIKHEYEPRISDKRWFKADFKVGRFYIEILGLKGVDFYDKRFDEKLVHFAMEQGPKGLVYCNVEDINKYKKAIEPPYENVPVVLLLIPKKHKLSTEEIGKLLGFLIPLYGKH